MEKYSYEMKQQLTSEIEKLQKKRHFVNILRIIKSNNPNIELTENKNGIFLFFDNLTDKTYIDINTYLQNIKNKKKNEKIDTDLLLSLTETDTIDTKLKFSNKEKSLIKKKMYNNVVDIQNEEAKEFNKKLKF